MASREGHFSSLGVVPRTIATVAVWSIAVVMALRLEHPLAGIAIGAIAACCSVVIWLTRGRTGGGA